MPHRSAVPEARPQQPHARRDLAVARRAATQHGVLSAAELYACGLDDHAILARVRNGRLFKRFRGVYAVGHDMLTLDGCFLAAVKACAPDAVLSFYAAAVMDALLPWDGRDPEVTAPNPRRHKGIHAHRSDTIERRYIRGIPVTPTLRTLIDLAGSPLPYAQLRRAVNEALNQRLIRLRDLVISDRRGANRLRRIIASAAPTMSELEDVLLAVIVQGGLPMPEVSQWHLGFKPDFRWPAQRVIVEADGKRTHDQALARADDAARQAHFEAHGELVLRVSWEQATLEPKATLRRIRRALDGRACTS
jgi:very-short-patch-repair endonuclease